MFPDIPVHTDAVSITLAVVIGAFTLLLTTWFIILKPPSAKYLNLDEKCVTQTTIISPLTHL
jgi:hypothetical protein